MPKRAGIAAGVFGRRRRSPRTLIEFASRLELDAAGLRDQSHGLSPARLSVAVGDVSLACDHLVDATEAWGKWLGCEVATSAAATANRELARDLRGSRDYARAMSVSLAELSRHNGRSGAKP